jgi:hypothetical protein
LVRRKNILYLSTLCSILVAVAWRHWRSRGTAQAFLVEVLSSLWEWFREGFLDAAQYRFFEALVMLIVGRAVAITPTRYAHLVEWLLE